MHSAVDVKKTSWNVKMLHKVIPSSLVLLNYNTNNNMSWGLLKVPLRHFNLSILIKNTFL